MEQKVLDAAKEDIISSTFRIWRCSPLSVKYISGPIPQVHKHHPKCETSFKKVSESLRRLVSIIESFNVTVSHSSSGLIQHQQSDPGR